jgi:hypothetical protein
MLRRLQCAGIGHNFYYETAYGKPRADMKG